LSQAGSGLLYGRTAAAAVVLAASTLSVELGVTVALLELTLGVVLTFLAGMEVDPAYMRRRLEPSLAIGDSSFAGAFVVASLVAFFLLDWTLRGSLIAGTALSTTSLAVVYASWSSVARPTLQSASC
jgi:hypothetical protein